MPSTKPSASSRLDKDPLPIEVLNAVIGGAGVAKKNDIDAEKAAAMTAGEEAPMTKADFAAAGGKDFRTLTPDDIKQLKLTDFAITAAASIADGPAFATTKGGEAKSEAKIEADLNKELRSHTGDVVTGANAGGITASAEKSGMLTKPGADQTAFKDAEWDKTKLGSAADHQNDAATKARGAADGEHGKLKDVEGKVKQASESLTSASEKVSQAKDAEKAAKDKDSAARLVVHEALKKNGFELNETEAGKAARNAADAAPGKIKAAELKLSEANKAAKAFNEKADGKIEGLKKEQKSETNGAEHRANIPGAIAYLEAQKEQMQGKVQSAEKNLVAAKAASDKADAEYKVFQNSTAAKAEHDAASRSVKSATSDETKAKKDLSEAETAKNAQAKTAADAEAHAKAKEDEARKGAKGAAEKSAQNDREQVNNLFKDQWKDLGGKLLRDVGIDVAKNAAKANNSYVEGPPLKSVLAGSGPKTVDIDASTKETRVGQVVAEGQTAYYSGLAGAGAEAQIQITAEAGKITETKNDDGSGQVTKTYAGASAEAHASAHVSWTGVAAEAGVKVAAHAEASHTFKSAGDSELKFYVQGDASAGAKAGATLGFDGIKLQASAKAEATASAGATAATKVIGNVDAQIDAKVYATAKAEATASAVVNFDPSKGAVGGGMKMGAVLSAGVGAETSGKLKGESGGYAEAGVGVHIGKLGVKAEVDVGYKDGALELKVDMGAYLGVGTDIKFNCKANFADAAKNASADIKSDNWFTKAKGIMSYTPGGFLARSIFG